MTNRIKHRAGSGFTLGSQEYPTLKELLKARKKDLGLKVLHLHLAPPPSYRDTFTHARFVLHPSER